MLSRHLHGDIRTRARTALSYVIIFVAADICRESKVKDQVRKKKLCNNFDLMASMSKLNDLKLSLPFSPFGL